MTCVQVALDVLSVARARVVSLNRCVRCCGLIDALQHQQLIFTSPMSVFLSAKTLMYTMIEISDRYGTEEDIAEIKPPHGSAR